MSQPRVRALLLVLALAGCGGRATVTGNVTYLKRPVLSGSVAILGSDGQPRTARIEAGGVYTITDVPSGDALLSVHSPDPGDAADLFEGEKLKLQKGIKPPPDRKIPQLDRSQWFPIPDDYGDFKRSGLKLTVQSGVNRYDLELR